MTSQPRIQSKTDFWTAWVLANWVASLAARWVLDAFRTYDQVSGSHIPVPFDGLAAGAMVGVVTGIFQWLMLRRQVYQTSKWAAATFMGWTIGLAVGWPMLKTIGDILGETVALTLVGLAIGFLQWLTLRTQVDRAGWWIPTSSCAWAAGLYLVGWVMAGWVFIRLWQRPKQDLPVAASNESGTHLAQASLKPKAPPSRVKSDIIFVVQWIGLSILSEYILFLASAMLTFSIVLLRDLVWFRIILVAIAWMFVGILMAALQSAVFHKYIPRNRAWITLTVLGMGLSGALIGFFLPGVMNTRSASIEPMIAGAGVGLLLGSLQWLVLRKRVSQAWLWILANIIGGAMGGVGGLPSIGLFLITISLFTGPLLVWLLHHPLPKKNAEPNSLAG